ncbi:MAG: hypothetical protein ACI9MC_003584 [Kiritimatiellia bacterium]|jgi:hypothetical protein
MSTRRAFMRGAVCLGAGAALWTTQMHRFFTPWSSDLEDVGPLPWRVRELLEAQLALWEESDQNAISAMRGFNPEWDLMGRTFLVLALADLSLRLPAESPRYLTVIDRIIDDTSARLRDEGMHHYLLGYARLGVWHSSPRSSLFIEGELAVMLGARRTVAEHDGYREAMSQRVRAIRELMQGGPVLCGESYPDECWMFCNAMALVALRMSEHLGGPSEERLRSAWVRTARERLIDPGSGMLVSSFAWNGTHKDGPEGSTIWLTAKSLLLVDEDLAREQYRLARASLGREVLGFAYATEWPVEWRGPTDIDSGSIVPVLDASAASSGHAIVAARAFSDHNFYRSLVGSLELAGFPRREGGRRRYLAGNQVGDAVILHGMVHGPLWRRLAGEA